MTASDQIPFAYPAFVDNPEPRCACLLLLDTSGSMNGKPIEELNAGLRAFKEAMASDPMAMLRVEVAVITFGPVNVLAEFQTADIFEPPHLSVTGDTPMGAAIMQGLDLLEDQKGNLQASWRRLLPPLGVSDHGWRTDRSMAASGGTGPRRR